MTIAIISHPDCLRHEPAHDIPEVPDRIRVIEEELIRSKLDRQLIKYSAPLATREQLERAHNKEYIDYVFKSSPEKGFFCLDLDTWMNSFSLNAALRAAGAAVHAVDLILSGKAEKVFCNVRPPGHHAEMSKAMGFCIFNNVAVGVTHALQYHHLKKVAIVDFDVHHGNGTEDIFRNEQNVLFCSSFEYPFYPFTGADTKSNHILNVTLPAGSNGAVFRKKVAESWFDAIMQFKPDMIFFSAGFDAYYQDVMSNLRWDEEDYAWITRKIVTIADDLCQGRVISLLEGGYALPTLGGCVAAHLREFIHVNAESA